MEFALGLNWANPIWFRIELDEIGLNLVWFNGSFSLVSFAWNFAASLLPHLLKTCSSAIVSSWLLYWKKNFLGIFSILLSDKSVTIWFAFCSCSLAPTVCVFPFFQPLSTLPLLPLFSFRSHRYSNSI